MARIATVYSDAHELWLPTDMSYIRWAKISEALARLGHLVDIVTNEPGWQQDRTPITMSPGLRRVPFHGLDWSRYDVVKTLFHNGFDVLERHGGARHLCIISKLGSVVGAEDRPGIYFYGALRESLLKTQAKIHRTSRYVTVLSEPAGDLFCETHGKRPGILLVPGAVDQQIIETTHNPFQGFSEKICIFSGNIYDSQSQPEANRILVQKLNELGRHLSGSGLRLCLQGHGDTSLLDPRYVTYLGSCPYEETWAYFKHAAVGIVVSAGKFMHNNESTKLYHYLRAGLPVVSEAGFPNDYVVREANLGYVVPSGNMPEMAAAIQRAVDASWDRERAVEYIMKNHTWDRRAEVYLTILSAQSSGIASRVVRFFMGNPLQTVAWHLRTRAFRTDG